MAKKKKVDLNAFHLPFFKVIVLIYFIVCLYFVNVFVVLFINIQEEAALVGL